MGVLDDAIRDHLELKRSHGADPVEVKRLEREALGPPTEADFEPQPEFSDHQVEFQDHAEHLEAPQAQPYGFDPEATALHDVAAEEFHEPLAPAAPDHIPAPEPAVSFEPAPLPPVAQAPATPPQQPAAAPVVPAAGASPGFARQPLRFPAQGSSLGSSALPSVPRPAAVPPPASVSRPAPARFRDALDEDFDFARGTTSSSPTPGTTPSNLNRSVPPGFTASPPPPATGSPAAPPAAYTPPRTQTAPSHSFAPSQPVQPAPAAPPAQAPPAAAGQPPAQPEFDPVTGDVLADTPDFLQETPEHDRLWFEQKPPRDFDF